MLSISDIENWLRDYGITTQILKDFMFPVQGKCKSRVKTKRSNFLVSLVE